MVQLSEDSLRQFVAERGWSVFHDPKNLSMALVAEAGELVALFQWLTPAESAHVMEDHLRATQVREEIADVTIYLLLLADSLEVDLAAAVDEKITINATRYPVELSRGRASKYTELR